MSDVILVPLEEIQHEARYYPRRRGQEDWRTVVRYTDALKRDPCYQFPPIVLARLNRARKGRKYQNVDGWHRYQAYLKAKREEIPAIVEALPESQWFKRAVELNVRHGRMLDTADRIFIATCLEKEHGMDRAAIAEVLQMRVATLTRLIAARVVTMEGEARLNTPGSRTIDGKTYATLKAPFAGREGADAEQAACLQGSVASGSVADVLRETEAILACGIDLDDEEVLQLLRRIKGLINGLALGEDT